MANNKRQIILVVQNVRSAHNVGAVFRSADAFAVEKIYICGYSPYPAAANDKRPPHIRRKTDKAVHKTALGAENSVPWEFTEDISGCLRRLRADGYEIVALEQTGRAADLNSFAPPEKTALIIGNELNGIDPEVLNGIKQHIQIPMIGKKESLNVASAASIALYHLRYY